MRCRMKRLHEQLQGYLEPSPTPTSVVAPTAALNARLPLGPDAPLPIGIRPIPASTQTNKKTNAQLPYVRKLVKDGSGGVFRYATEGDAVFVERAVAIARERKVHLPLAHAVAHTFDEVNALLLDQGAVKKAYTRESFPFPLDGVVNNVDGADEQGEFRDHALANVAVQGPCRLTMAGFERSPVGNVLYVGVETKTTGSAPNETFEHRLVRFSARTIFNGNYTFSSDGFSLAFAYKLGRVIDAAQSAKMMTVLVDVEPLADVVVPAKPGTPGSAKRATAHAQEDLWWDTTAWRYVVRWGESPVLGDKVEEKKLTDRLEKRWTTK